MKGAVLDPEDILRPEVITGEKILISDRVFQEMKLVVGKGYFLEADRQLKELKSEGKLLFEPISFEEFLEWCDEDTLAEWVNGKIIHLSPASRRHQDLVGFLLSILRVFVEEKGLGKVYSEQFRVKLSSRKTGERCYMPDILYISKERENLIRDTYFEGSPDLAVEIVSRESRQRDKGEKFEVYENCGVREYWIIDSELNEACFYRRDEKGKFKEQKPDATGIYHSEVLPGFKLKVEWLWQDPLPTIREALQELGLI